MSYQLDRERLKKERPIHQRLWDLVRQQRVELHDADLISDDEYTELAVDHPAVERLETYDALRAENERLRASCLNQCADNLCWLSDPEGGKALPESEFLESCRRYRNQIAGTSGELTTKTMTIAQLEQKCERLEGELAEARRDNERLKFQVAECRLWLWRLERLGGHFHD